MKRTIIRASLWSITGLAVGIILMALEIHSVEEAAFIILIMPVYFLGIGFCRWSLLRKIFLGILGEQIINRRDKYHVVSNLAGGLVLSYIVIFGWLVGLVRFIRIIFRLCKGNSYGNKRST